MESENFRSSFVISLFSIGEVDSCLFSWFCFPCAIAQSRTYLDNSSCLFNYFCLNCINTRWLIRNSYGIQGDPCNDCWTAFFCPCCSANQLYQTSKQYGQVSNDGGLAYNTGTWVNSFGSGTLQDFFYAFFCMPCSVGKILERSIGMPWYLGCLCTNPCASRNLIRYQYRIAGNDLIEECAIPYGLKFFADITQSCIPFVWLLVYGIFAVGTMQQLKEVESRSGTNSSQRYLVREPTNQTPPIAPGEILVYLPNQNNSINNNSTNAQQVQMFQPVRASPIFSSGYTRLNNNNNNNSNISTHNPVVGIPVHEKL